MLTGGSDKFPVGAETQGVEENERRATMESNVLSKG